MPSSVTRPQQTAQTLSSESGRNKSQFADLIRQFASRNRERSIFSGDHFRFLSEYLDSSRNTKFHSSNSSLASTQFAPVHLVTFRSHGGHGRDPSSHSNSSVAIVPVDTGTDIGLSVSQCMPGSQESLLLLLSGWQSADWLRILSAQCGIEPELLRRHLAFLETRTFYDQPSLPSNQLDVWRLRTVAIYVRKQALRPDQVHKVRGDEKSDIRRYLHKLRLGQLAGASILRQHATINETTSAIIQDISLCVHTKKSGGWIGTAWIDSGRPLDSSTVPWFVMVQTETGEDTNPYIPFVLHRPKMAISSTSSSKPTPLPSGPSGSSTAAAPQGPCPSFSYLPNQYGSSLDHNLARVDALYAFSELIALAASTENQLLNTIQAQIRITFEGYRGIEYVAMETLQYCTMLLDDLVDRTKETIYCLENEEHNKWPRAAESTTRDMTKRLLLDDYHWILERGQAMKQRVQDGLAAITTDVTARDAQRAMAQARKMGHVTVLAYFFLPLSFTTSIYGMNFAEFSDKKWGVCAFLVTLVFIMLPSLTLCFSDRIPWALVRRWVRRQ